MGAIDIHSHVIPPELLREIRKHPHRYPVQIVEHEGERRLVCPDHDFPLLGEFDQVELKLASMDRRGLEVSVLSVAPIVFFYDQDPALARETSMLINDGIAAMVAGHPGRFQGMGTLPLQDAEAACREMERCVREHGFGGFEVGTTVEEEQLSSERLLGVLKKAQELGVFLFAHPYFCGPKCGLDGYYLINLIGNPLNTVKMVAHLMFSGRLEQLPGLRWVLSHGGGYVPYQLPRLQHGWTWRRECRQHCQAGPAELARRLYYDCLTHSPESTRFLIDTVGADHVMLGTDSPFGMGEDDPLGHLRAVPGLSPEQQEWVREKTARQLLQRRPLHV